jgi:hypothetical protein
MTSESMSSFAAFASFAGEGSEKGTDLRNPQIHSQTQTPPTRSHQLPWEAHQRVLSATASATSSTLLLMPGDAWLFTKLDRERVGVGEVFEFHDCMSDVHHRRYGRTVVSPGYMR